MPRNQRAITEAQVRYKVDEAKLRIHAAIVAVDKCYDEEQYDKVLADMHKAYTDYATWSNVLDALK